MEEIVKNMVSAGERKTQLSLGRLILSGIMAGMFIGGGAAAASVAMHTISDVGVARLLGGAVFPVGLMMIVIAGGELFTGDCLMIIGVLKRKYTLPAMLRVLAVVWISNLAGALAAALLVYFSGQQDYTGGLLGAYSVKAALSKVNMTFIQGFTSGIMCNIFVCAAVLMASAAKEVSGKICAVFFPIMAFVLSGYEHCVANMYYIPMGILAKNNDTYVKKAAETYGYSAEMIEKLNWKSFFANNMLSVTLGNMAGGIICIGMAVYFAGRKKEKPVT